MAAEPVDISVAIDAITEPTPRTRSASQSDKSPRTLRNVEIKAQISGTIDEWRARLEKEFPTRAKHTLTQTDVFFKTPPETSLRLKMRFQKQIPYVPVSTASPSKTNEVSKDSAALISYNRNNQTGPKLSEYQLLYLTVGKATMLSSILEKVYGTSLNVSKTRHLWIVEMTLPSGTFSIRIHLDFVFQLGVFIEFEVVLTPQQTVADGQTIARMLLDKLDIKDNQLITGAYHDLLIEKLKEE